jgi:hypothetical protein
VASIALTFNENMAYSVSITPCLGNLVILTVLGDSEVRVATLRVVVLDVIVYAIGDALSPEMYKLHDSCERRGQVIETLQVEPRQ